jgi:hypothetical protein
MSYQVQRRIVTIVKVAKRIVIDKALAVIFFFFFLSQEIKNLAVDRDVIRQNLL